MRKLTLIQEMPHVLNFHLGHTKRKNYNREQGLVREPIKMRPDMEKHRQEDGLFHRWYWDAVVDVTEEKKGVLGIGAIQFGETVEVQKDGPTPAEILLKLIDDAYLCLKEADSVVKDECGECA